MENKSTQGIAQKDSPVVEAEAVQEDLPVEGTDQPVNDIVEGKEEGDVAEEHVENQQEEEVLDNGEGLQGDGEVEQPAEYNEQDNIEQQNDEAEESDEEEPQEYEQASEQGQEGQAQEQAPQQQITHEGPSSTIYETLITPVPASGSEIFCEYAYDPEPLESEYEQQSQSEIEHVYGQQQPVQEWRDDEIVLRNNGENEFMAKEYDFAMGQVQEEMIDQAQRESLAFKKNEERENLEIAVQVEIEQPVVNEHEVKEAATQSTRPLTMKSAPPTTDVPKGQQARLTEESNNEPQQIEESRPIEQVPKQIIPPEEPKQENPSIVEVSNANPIISEVKQQPKNVEAIQEKPVEKPKTKKKAKESKESKESKVKKPVEVKKVETTTITEQSKANPPIVTQPKEQPIQPEIQPQLKEEARPAPPKVVEKIEVQKPEQKKYQVKVVEKNAFKSSKKNDEPQHLSEEQQPARREEIPQEGPNNILLLRNRIHEAELQKKEKEEQPTAQQLVEPRKENTKVETQQARPKVERQQPHSKMGPAKKKKKKKVAASSHHNQDSKIQPNNRPLQSASKPEDSRAELRRASNLNSEIDQGDKASMVHESRDPSQPSHPSQRNLVNMISPELIAAESQAKMPILTSLIVVKQAEKQRVGTTYKMFLKYNYEYERTVSNYRRIVDDVCNEISKKKESKRPLQRLLQEYFQDFCKQCREYNERCYKIQIQDQVVNQTTNKFANIKLEMKKGFDEMVYLRKSIANNSHRLNTYASTTVLGNIRKAFEVYHSLISQEEAKQRQRREDYYRRAKIFNKTLSQVDKNFNKGLQGKVKDDLFVEITRFINEEKVHRVALRNFGRGLVDLRNTFIRCEKELFDTLQDILNKFKTESKAIYCFGPRIFDLLQDYSHQIKAITRFQQLCTLTDLDYIKYVLEIQSKKETNQFSNRNFQSYLDLIFFDRVVGNIRDTLKGATNKIFPMENASEELIHSISGNLVLFSRQHDLCKDKYEIKNLNAKIIGAGFVQFDELLKGVIFDDNRTIRLKLRDEDRAEELICYLNEKEEDILLDHGRV